MSCTDDLSILTEIGSESLDEAAVVVIYQAILGRLPEADEIVAGKILPNAAALGLRLVANVEFHRRHKTLDYYDKWAQVEIFAGLAKIWINLRDKYVSFGCLIDNYEPEESAIIREFLKPGNVAVDVGANLGWFVLLSSLNVGSQGSVVAFEPNPEVFRRLEMTVSANVFASNVRLYKQALSNKSGTATLCLEAGRNLGAAYLSDRIDGEVSYTVPLTKLDEIGKLERLDLLKIDVEGHEGFALEGGRATIERCHPVILAEFCEDFLDRCGYGANRFFELLDSLRYRSYVIGLSGHAVNEGRMLYPLILRDLPRPDTILSVLLVPEAKTEEVFARLGYYLRERGSL